MATARAIIRKNKINQYGETLVYILYMYKDQKAQLSTGIKVKPESFIKSNQDNPISRKEQNHTVFNRKIRDLKQKVNDTADKLRFRGEEPTPELVKAEMTKTKFEHKKERVFLDEEIFESWIIANSSKAKQTSKNYRVFINNLKLYINDYGPIKISEVNHSLYNKLVNYLFEKREQNENSVGSFIKNLKVFCKWMSMNGENVPEDYKTFKVLTSPEQIFYLDQEETKKYFEFDLPPGQAKARDLWCFQASTGFRISDLKRFNKTHVSEQSIKLLAYKNRKQTYVPIVNMSRTILERYNYDLPKLSDQVYRRSIKAGLKKAGIHRIVEKVTYKGGKKIYKEVPIYEVISSHEAVKTFITHCVQEGIDPAVVARMTGKTTEVLIKNYYGTNEKHIQNEMQRAFG